MFVFNVVIKFGLFARMAFISNANQVTIELVSHNELTLHLQFIARLKIKSFFHLGLKAKTTEIAKKPQR